MAEDIEYAILKAPIERFLEATDEIDQHVWGFKFMRAADEIGSSSSVIGVYAEEIDRIASEYRQLLSEIKRLGAGKCSEKSCRCLSFRLNDFPVIDTEYFVRQSSGLIPNPFVHYKRFRATLRFQDVLRNIQALFYQIIDCLEYAFTGKSYFLPERYYKDYVFQ